MRAALRHLDKWGPGLVSILALFGVAAFGWYMSERVARLEGFVLGLRGQLADRTEIELALRTEVTTWQAYVVSLKEAMIRSGIEKIPPPPRPVDLRQDGTETSPPRR